MKILLVYAEYPETFWSFKHSLGFFGKKAAFPPLGLLTVAAMLPREWDKRLVDLNAAALRDEDLRWADYVFLSAMAVQQVSARQVIDRCRQLGKPVVAGGPLFTPGYEDFGFDEIDHLVQSESEGLMPELVSDLENGRARHIYATGHADMATSPVPLWSLLDHRIYQTMAIQYSRGCPFDCEFCDIVVMSGRVPRTKTPDQVVAELDAIHATGFHGNIFFVDDNFIGNKRKLKSEILPAIQDWMDHRHHPFTFFTEASANLADDEELMQQMREARFNRLFIGIETTNPESLAESNKTPNKNRDLLDSVRRLQQHGFEVMGGFIVGFDSDPPTIFDQQIEFIQRSGIVTAMVGILNAPPETRLFKRMTAEGRIRSEWLGDSADGRTNIVSRMPAEMLVKGHRRIITTIYRPREYYERLLTYYGNLGRRKKRRRGAQGLRSLPALFKAVWLLGVREVGRRYYWRAMAILLLRKPKALSRATHMAITGYHFRKIAQGVAERSLAASSG